MAPWRFVGGGRGGGERWYLLAGNWMRHGYVMHTYPTAAIQQ